MSQAVGKVWGLPVIVDADVPPGQIDLYSDGKLVGRIGGPVTKDDTRETWAVKRERFKRNAEWVAELFVTFGLGIACGILIVVIYLALRAHHHG